MGALGRLILRDDQWERIAPHIIGDERSRGTSGRDNRLFVEGVLWIVRTGSPWRDLPERYGPYTTVYNRFNRWAKKGVWLSIFEALSARSPQSLQLIDSSIVRAHQHAAGGK